MLWLRAHPRHDVVAHRVSVMVVQAGAARRVLDRDPVPAGDAMPSIEATGQQSLNELRRLLGMLRRAEVDAPRADDRNRASTMWRTSWPRPARPACR